MPLIGSGLVTVVALILWARSSHPTNKAGVGILWGGYLAQTAGWL